MDATMSPSWAWWWPAPLSRHGVTCQTLPFSAISASSAAG